MTVELWIQGLEERDAKLVMKVLEDLANLINGSVGSGGWGVTIGSDVERRSK